jgi:hypothetical protein
MEAYVDYQNFIQKTGIDLDATDIEPALSLAANTIKRSVFLQKSYVFSQPSDKFRIDVPVADINCDGVIDKKDISVFLHDPYNYVNPDTDLSTHVTSFNPKYGYVVLDEVYPTYPKVLIIESYKSRYEYDVMKEYLERLNILIATQQLFNTIPFAKLQEGISSWTLNGVTVAFDLNSMLQIKEGIKSEISAIFKIIQPIHSKTTSLGFDLDDVKRHKFYFRSPSGHLYSLRPR